VNGIDERFYKKPLAKYLARGFFMEEYKNKPPGGRYNQNIFEYKYEINKLLRRV